MINFQPGWPASGRPCASGRGIDRGVASLTARDLQELATDCIDPSLHVPSLGLAIRSGLGRAENRRSG